MTTSTYVPPTIPPGGLDAAVDLERNLGLSDAHRQQRHGSVLCRILVHAVGELISQIPLREKI